MANKLVKKSLKHYYEDDSGRPIPPAFETEPDKTKSISELNRRELSEMRSRLQTEVEVQRIIKELKRNSGEQDTYSNPVKVDATTPIQQLYHHGILGMKWGVRRYQKEDGTRTPAGKKRERKDGPTKSEDHMTSRISKSKGTGSLSNDELRKLNERLQLEETYKRLTVEKVQKSESWVKKALSSASEQALTDFSKSVFLGSAKLLVKEVSPQFAEIAFNIKKTNNREG